MNCGRLCCIGSQSHLKNKFGSGYQLKFHCTSGRAPNVERFIQTNLNGAVHIETYAGIFDQCHLTLLQHQNSQFLLSKLRKQLISYMYQAEVLY